MCCNCKIDTHFGLVARERKERERANSEWYLIAFHRLAGGDAKVAITRRCKGAPHGDSGFLLLLDHAYTHTLPTSEIDISGGFNMQATIADNRISLINYALPVPGAK